METSENPSPELRTNIVNTMARRPIPAPAAISAEAKGIYRYLTGNTLGYPTEAETVTELSQYRLAALTGVALAELAANWADTGDPTYIEVAANEFTKHPRAGEDAEAVIEPIMAQLGPVVAAVLPHLIKPGVADHEG